MTLYNQILIVLLTEAETLLIAQDDLFLFFLMCLHLGYFHISFTLQFQ